MTTWRPTDHIDRLMELQKWLGDEINLGTFKDDPVPVMDVQSQISEKIWKLENPENQEDGE